MVDAGGVGTASARGRDGASGDDGIVATADELGFDTLIAAVEAANPVVLETLTNDDQYTVFAPTDHAFSNFFDTVESATGIDKNTLLTDPDNLLTETLLYHVTEGRRYAASIAPVSKSAATGRSSGRDRGSSRNAIVFEGVRVAQTDAQCL